MTESYIVMGSTNLYVFFVLFCNAALTVYGATIIVIDPAGDSAHNGRTLHQSSERAESYKCAQEIKNNLETDDAIKVILSRRPGHRVHHLQTASLANRLNASLVVRIHICKGEDSTPTLYAYHLAYDTIVDFAKRTPQELAFTPLHQAHFAHIHQSIQFGNIVLKTVHTYQSPGCSVCPHIYGLPIKPLIGIVAPALALEITVPNSDQQWQAFVEPLAQSIRAMIQRL